MAEITISEPDGPYKATIDTEVMDVTLRKVFVGVGFETEDGCHLSVCMRDDGYEVRLDDGPWISLRPDGDESKKPLDGM